MGYGVRALAAVAAFTNGVLILSNGACAEQRLLLAAKPEKGAALTVTAVQGRFDRLAKAAFEVKLSLRAEPAVESSGAKILSSELFLKPEGTNSIAHSISALDGKALAGAQGLDKTFTFPIDPHGPVAQNAFALCGGLAKDVKSAVMVVPLVWRVTSGRFNFRYVQANFGAHSVEAQDLTQNPDFYGDHETQEIEMPVSVTVSCDSAVEIAESKPAKKTATSVPASAKAPAPAATAAVPAASAQLKHQITYAGEAKSVSPMGESKNISQNAAKPSASATAPPPATIAAAELPRCEGGMLRAISSEPSGYLCLCPGNTRRMETGVNAFLCAHR